MKKPKPEVNVLIPEGMSRRHFLKLMGVAGAAVAVAGLPTRTFAAGNTVDTLNFFTWSLYGSDTLNAAYKAKSGVTIHATYYSSSDEMIAKLRGGGTRLYDMCVPEQYNVKLAADNGLLEPMNKAHLTNYQNVMKPFQENPFWEFDGKFYGVPLDWGANAIAYNRKAMGTEVDSLDALFDPKWKGQIGMRDDSVDSIAVAALKLGIKDPFHMDESALQECKKALIAQKPLVRAYWTNIASVQNMMASGEIVVSWAWLAVIKPLQKIGIDAQWVWPKEGALGWNEGVSAVKGTKKLSAVEDYANWTISKEYGVNLAEKTGYAPTNQEAVNALPDQLVKDLGIDVANMSRLIFKAMPANKARWDEIWNEVKAA